MNGNGIVQSLERQAKNLDSAKPVPKQPGVYSIRIGVRETQISQEELERVRRQFRVALAHGLTDVRVRIAGGRSGHEAMAKIRQDQWIVGGISDVLGGVKIPPLSIWRYPELFLSQAQTALRNNRFYNTIVALKWAEITSIKAYRRYREYRYGTIKGGERAVTTLEATRDVSFAAAGIMATIATGGVAGAAISTAITTTGTIAQQAVEVDLGLRDQIDWEGIKFDALFGLITSRLGGSLGNAIARRLVSNPAVASLGRRAVARIVSNLVAGKASSILHMTGRTLFDVFRGVNKQMTVDQFIGQLAAQLTDPKSAFMDILWGEIGRRFAAKTPPTHIKGQPSVTSTQLPVKPSRKRRQHTVKSTQVSKGGRRTRTEGSQDRWKRDIQSRTRHRKAAPRKPPSTQYITTQSTRRGGGGRATETAPELSRKLTRRNRRKPLPWVQQKPRRREKIGRGVSLKERRQKPGVILPWYAKEKPERYYFDPHGKVHVYRKKARFAAVKGKSGKGKGPRSAPPIEPAMETLKYAGPKRPLTKAEVDAGVKKAPGHEISWEQRRAGKTLKVGQEKSGREEGSKLVPIGKEQGKTHTEYKLIQIAKREGKPGDTYHMDGLRSPCRPHCRPALRKAAMELDITFVYRAAGETWTFFPSGRVTVRLGGRTYVMIEEQDSK